MSRHSSRIYATPLRLEPAGSRALWLLVLLLHLAGLAAVIATPLPQPVMLAAYAGWSGSLAASCLRLAWRGAGTLRCLTWQSGRDCTLELYGGRTLPARLQPRAFVHSRLVILYYRRGAGRIRSLPLCPDMFDTTTWRRLRVRLNTQLPVTDEDPERSVR